MRFRPVLVVILLVPVFTLAQIPQSKVCGSVAQYFRLNRLAPELLDVNVFEHPTEGRTMRIRIAARRSQSRRDIGLAFSAAAAVANCSEKQFDLLWVEMVITYKDKENSSFIAPAYCTINALINQEITMEQWWEDCVQVL